MPDLVQTVEAEIRSRRLLRRGEKVLVAVSGGLDSVVLLDVLHRLSSKYGWQLTVAHLNHQLRGRSSDADEKLVRGTARTLRLNAVVERADVRALMKAKRLSLEMAAREARHKFLARTARRRRIPTIALAHQADDQVELFLLRLLRGSGSEGLGGMPWRSASPADNSLRIIRPLLGIPKNTLLEYANERHLEFREDASNRSLDILRNRIRHELLPLLQKWYQPAVHTTLSRTIEILQEESRLVEDLAQKHLDPLGATKGNQKHTRLERLPVAIQRKLLQQQLIRAGIVPEFDLVEKLRAAPNIKVCVSGLTGDTRPVLIQQSNSRKLAAKKSRREQRGLIVSRDELGLVHAHSTFQTFPEKRLRLNLTSASGSAGFDGLTLHWEVMAHAGAGRLKKSPGTECFDADKVGTEVILRHWRPGDRFQPIGLHSAVKIQDFFTNEKIPRIDRHRLVLAATPQGEVFWIEGMRIADRFKLTNRTIRRLHWSWERV